VLVTEVKLAPVLVVLGTRLVKASVVVEVPAKLVVFVFLNAVVVLEIELEVSVTFSFLSLPVVEAVVAIGVVLLLALVDALVGIGTVVASK
jgi:hypothetical protein